MANANYIPQFPFKNNQIILSSDRVFLHSKSDGVLLFGNSTVALSSMGTVNIDSVQKTVICSPKIELCGLDQNLQSKVKIKADQQVVLGNNLNLELSRFLEKIIEASKELNGVSSDEKQLTNSMQKITAAADILNKAAVGLKEIVDSPNSYILSKVTYTA